MTVYVQKEPCVFPTCPYCKTPAVCVNGGEVYKGNVPHLQEKLFWVCFACDARVGTHYDDPDPDYKGPLPVPLGSLADKGTREARGYAHTMFDKLWRWKMDRDNMSKHDARKSAYAWMAKAMDLKPEDAHIALFDKRLCYKLMRTCRPYVLRIDRLSIQNNKPEWWQ